MAPRRSTSGRRIRVAASLLMLGGCAGMYEATGTASQQDMLQLRTDLNSLPVSLQRTRAEVDAALAQMDRRLAEQPAEGGYLLAITGFRDFLRRFPDHKLADNAQYWIGESYLALAHSYANAGQQDDKATQALEEAVREFRRVITNYPRGDKVPTAIYKEA